MKSSSLAPGQYNDSGNVGIFYYLLPLHPDKLPFRPVLTPIFQQMGALFFLNLCQITDPDMVVLKGFLRCWLVYSKKDYSKY